MSRAWQLQEAKNKLSEVVEKAIHDGPQRVTKRGQDAVVVISAKEYARMKRGKQSLVEFLQSSPLRDLDLERTRDYPREVEL